MFNKLGEALSINASNIQSTESVVAEMGGDYVNQRFQKFANELKRIAPKASDFLYFYTRYITAAEAALINEDGSPKLDKQGQPITAQWEKKGDSWKWVCSDPTIRPVKNANGDIFPESELIQAHKKWIERPLCVDHKSDSVDAVRGIILDSYYDRKHKYAVALIALDKVTFPDLARGIQAGYKSSVSMGTRVAKAICYDCGTVASTESEFCSCMRQKKSWGEINIGLDPIEISLVVSGADPHAKIRTILAAANGLRSNLDSTEQQLSKLSINQASLDKFKELEDDLHKLSDKLTDLKSDLEHADVDDNKAEAPYGQTGDLAMKEADFANVNQNLAITDRLASNNHALRSELQDLKHSIGTKFQSMEKSLASLSHKIKEDIMTVNSNNGVNKEAYFQGGGGVNEPTPHKVKYPKEPLNEQLRNSGDKQMMGQSPFPDVGDVKGLHPSPASVDERDELARKQMIQRAEIDERKLRRAAALDKAKKGYFQGGGELNEPTPGKVRYPIDLLAEKDRLKEDKQMVGAKPFPGVGDVDGLYDDDLKRKQLLQRASLKARFIRVTAEDGSQDLGQSAWEVTRDGDVLFSATVDEITGGKADTLYDVVASKDFATKMLEKVYKLGAAQASKLYKSAQAVAGMGSMPLAAPETGSAAPVPPMPDMGAPMPAGEPAAPMAEPAKDSGADGDPKEVALKLATEMRDRASDLLEAIRVLTGEQAEMGDLEEVSKKAASSEFTQLVDMKRTLRASLLSGLKKAVAELNEHQEELATVTNVLGGEPLSDFTASVVNEALVDAKSAIADTRDLMSSVVKYANGSKQLLKQAQMLDANSDHDGEHDDEHDEFEHADENEVAQDAEAAMDDDKPMDEDMNDAEVSVKMDSGDLSHLPAGSQLEVKKADLSTKEARAAERAKLAAKALEFNPMLDEAHALANGQTQLDVKPSDNLGRVETLEEQHAAFLEVAEAPPKVRKEAARLNQLIVAGKVAKSDLDTLVAQGLDAEVVKYWKQFYGQAGKEGSEFASELLKEHAKAQIDEEVSRFKIKIARAYELTNEMVRRSLVTDDRAAITAQVEDMMNWNDEGFDAMKRMVNKHPLRKSASYPQVGLIGSGDTTSATPEPSLQEALDRVFSGRRFF